jgi:hypothetical protein
MAQCDQCRPPTFPLRTSFSGLDRLAISQLRCTFNEPITKTAAAPRWEIRLSPPRWLLRCIRRRKGRGRVDLDRDHGESDRPGMLVAHLAVEQPTGYVLTQTCWRKCIRSSPWARPIQTAGQATRPGSSRVGSMDVIIPDECPAAFSRSTAAAYPARSDPGFRASPASVAAGRKAPLLGRLEADAPGHNRSGGRVAELNTSSAARHTSNPIACRTSPACSTLRASSMATSSSAPSIFVAPTKWPSGPMKKQRNIGTP